MTISKEWQERIDEKLKPYGSVRWTSDVVAIAKKLVEGRNSIVLLDAGCGVDSWIVQVIRGACPSVYAIGIDIDPDCVKNPHVDEAHVSSLTEIPLDSNSVDFIVSAWVAEHIEKPSEALAEMYRVLKPGGAILLWTSNLYNPAMLVARFSPHWFHTWWRGFVSSKEHAENAPTFYRVNTVSKLKHIAANNGLVCEHIELFSTAYQYFAVCKFSYVVACILNKLTAIWPFSRLKLLILCVLRKPKTTE